MSMGLPQRSQRRHLRASHWLTLIALAFAALAAFNAGRADAAFVQYQGAFSRSDGSVRCVITNNWAQCVSMQTGRVATLNRDGSTETYFTTDASSRGRTTKAFLVNRSRTIACRAGSRYVTCLAPRWDSSFTLDTQYVLTEDYGFQDFLDDSPPVAPVPVGYVPPVRYTPPNAIPDYSDPGGTYGTISTVTGLPRTYYVRPYVRSNGTYVSGYYRSCSRCG